MGGSQSAEKKIEIINETKVQTALKNINENINEIVMNVIQENLIKTAAGSNIKQEMKITGLKAKEDITISDITQKAQIEISLSSLSNNELQQDLVSETMNELQTKLQESMKMSQEAAEKKGEQFIAEMAAALSGAMSSVTGSTVKEKKETSIQNLLEIKSDTELVNIIKQSVSTDLINRTISEVSNIVVTEQSAEISNIESTTGGIVVSNINQDVLSKQILEAINNVGTTSEIISGISNISKTEIKKAIEAGQKTASEQEGTLQAGGQALGGVIGAVGDAYSGILQSLGGMIIIPILLVGGAILFIFRGTISKIAQKKAGIPTRRVIRRPMQQMRPIMRGGANGFKSIYKKIKKMIRKLSKYINMKNLIILVVSIITIIIIYKGYQIIRYNRIEWFSNESKNTNLTISYNGQFLKNKKLGDNHLCFIDNKDKAYKFDVSVINDKDIYIVTMIGDNKYYLRIVSDEVIIEQYDFINDSSYKFQFEKSGDVYNLLQGDKKVSVKDECLIIGKEPVDLLFE